VEALPAARVFAQRFCAVLPRQCLEWIRQEAPPPDQETIQFLWLLACLAEPTNEVAVASFLNEWLLRLLKLSSSEDPAWRELALVVAARILTAFPALGASPAYISEREGLSLETAIYKAVAQGGDESIQQHCTAIVCSYADGWGLQPVALAAPLFGSFVAVLKTFNRVIATPALISLIRHSPDETTPPLVQGLVFWLKQLSNPESQPPAVIVSNIAIVTALLQRLGIRVPIEYLDSVIAMLSQFFSLDQEIMAEVFLAMAAVWAIKPDRITEDQWLALLRQTMNTICDPMNSSAPLIRAAVSLLADVVTVGTDWLETSLPDITDALLARLALVVDSGTWEDIGRFVLTSLSKVFRVIGEYEWSVPKRCVFFTLLEKCSELDVGFDAAMFAASLTDWFEKVIEGYEVLIEHHWKEYPESEPVCSFGKYIDALIMTGKNMEMIFSNLAVRFADSTICEFTKALQAAHNRASISFKDQRCRPKRTDLKSLNNLFKADAARTHAFRDAAAAFDALKQKW
jgi:hypothetical protein